MPTYPIRYKDAGSTLDFPVDWTDWLAEISDTIKSVVWLVPSGITQVSVEFTDTIAKIFLSGGGAVGSEHTIECQITTNGGRVSVPQTFIVVIVEK